MDESRPKIVKSVLVTWINGGSTTLLLSILQTITLVSLRVLSLSVDVLSYNATPYSSSPKNAMGVNFIMGSKIRWLKQVL
ncbi:MAG: hypothetical protein QG670_2389 [Thermoproteota archaeon]|nr:hypothetical protein [Thermoproteota archaeon]